MEANFDLRVRNKIIVRYMIEYNNIIVRYTTVPKFGLNNFFKGN